jgi:Uma2 family endonuclease
MEAISEALIYEIVSGKPIYYKGYRDVLDKTKTTEEVKFDTLLQAWLKAHLALILNNHLADKKFEITVGKLGLNISENDRRVAAITVFSEKNFVLADTFSILPPEIIIEIDVQADTETENESNYITQKVYDCHRFGVKKVIWIFSKKRKVLVAPVGEAWTTVDWEKDVLVMEGLTMNLATIVDKRSNL